MHTSTSVHSAELGYLNLIVLHSNLADAGFVACDCRYIRGKGKFGRLSESEIVTEITIPALRNDLTQELFREITRQVPFLHDKDPCAYFSACVQFHSCC